MWGLGVFKPVISSIRVTLSAQSSNHHNPSKVVSCEKHRKPIERRPNERHTAAHARALNLFELPMQNFQTLRLVRSLLIYLDDFNHFRS
jgi:hypothetical protein